MHQFQGKTFLREAFMYTIHDKGVMVSVMDLWSPLDSGVQVRASSLDTILQAFYGQTQLQEIHARQAG